MTNFINGVDPKKEKKETVFNYLLKHKALEAVSYTPSYWKNVKLISRTDEFDVFECWDVCYEDKAIYIGHAGSEFD